MLTEIYIEALLVDQEAADLVWDRWDAGQISDEAAEWEWQKIVLVDQFRIDPQFKE